ncbi:MAG: hypothetical protein ACYC5G_05165 [Candidatus Doudnabacteria bacterium]
MRFISKTNLKHGSIEFNRLQELIRNEYWDIINRLTYTYGLIINQTTGVDVWKVTQTGNNAILINAGKGIVLDANGKPRTIELTANYAITNVPAVDGTYEVLVKHALHNLEKGTITLTNSSTTVTGSGTEFTKILGANRKLIVGDYAYSVQSVESDTSLTLTSNFVGTTTAGLQFKVGGWFISEPALIADKLIYEHGGLEFVVKTGTKNSNEYWLAELTVSGGVITVVTDKRDQNYYILHRSYAYTLRVPHTYTIPGVINLPVGDTDYVCPFFIKFLAGQSAKFSMAMHRINSGNAITVKLQKNGVDITGFTGISVSTTTTVTDPVDVVLADGDMLQLVVTAVGATPAKNLTFTLFIEYTVQ